jgi:hypothetical protein
MREAEDEKDVDELSERRICSQCVGDEYLKKEILAEGTEADCDYCDASGKTISMEELADRVEAAFTDHYVRTPTEPSGFEYAMAKEEGGWDRPGDQAEWAIGGAASLDESPARHVTAILEDRHYDREAAQMGDESEFDRDSYYERKDIDDYEFQEAWRFFESSVTADARHFNSAAESTLDEIFGDLNQHRTSDERPSIVEAGPDHEIKAFFRGRVFQSTGPLLNALESPEREIGPPPMRDALAGRMNARGVSVFYGATEPGTAIAELRPPVGSRVVLGRFELLHPVRLLDVRALKDVVVEGSIFDPSYLRRLERAKYLERLSARISMAVMPHDETLDYIVTQVIADYLATRENPALDGILYPSSQQSDRGANVVLFHKSSAVLIEPLPSGSTVKAIDGWNTEDGFEIDYRVSEEIPSPTEGSGPVSRVPDFQDFLISPLEYTHDGRTPMLKLDTNHISVHHVEAVKYTTTSRRVERTRTEKRDQSVQGPQSEEF